MPSAPVLASLALLTVLTVVGGLITLTGLFDLHRASTWWLLLTVVLIVIGGGVGNVQSLYRAGRSDSWRKIKCDRRTACRERGGACPARRQHGRR